MVPGNPGRGGGAGMLVAPGKGGGMGIPVVGVTCMHCTSNRTHPNQEVKEGHACREGVVALE
jgi:hypothetical protein